ncbi:MAG: hypothetical protein EBT92_00985 [Planctomycetes bacterium]|nr:hypothetical protein [Planctomycetota bacterium]NBY03414.1 hypothetical protein [Planctomycetota bacterium]
MELSSLIIAFNLISANQNIVEGIPGRPTPAILFADPPAPEKMVFYPKESAYSHWQNLAVDRLGSFKPRVVYSPHGSFYLYNGMSYPFMDSRTGNFSPTELGFKSFNQTYSEVIEVIKEEVIIEEKK